jgi:hypothetical protein
VNRVSDGSGGTTLSAPFDLPAQTVRIVYQNLRSDDTTLSPSGDVQTITHIAVGAPDLNVRRGDELDYRGQHYEVNRVVPGPYATLHAYMDQVSGV